MLPVIALVGRTNVGKSTLFNRLTGSRQALVADYPGLTRDRQYGFAQLERGACLIIDTGGLHNSDDPLDPEMQAQTDRAIDEADALIFLVDGREGLNALDLELAAVLRQTGKAVYPAVNKLEGATQPESVADFFQLGIGEPLAISALGGDNVHELMNRALQPLGDGHGEIPDSPDDAIRIAVIGRPNVGKSTLVNRLLGEDRVLASAQPGTTRDSIYVSFEHRSQDYTLIDTAGIRRRARVHEAIEKFSVVKALQAMEHAHVVVALADAVEGISDQDASLFGLCVERGRALVLAINKCDAIGSADRRQIEREIDRKLEFLSFADVHWISALRGTRVSRVLISARRAFRAAQRDLATPALTRALARATEAHPPPMVRGRRIRLRYAHQGGKNPPRIVVHGNQTGRLPRTYRRYLSNFFRREFALQGTPLKIVLKTGGNPFAGRRNSLTPRQQQKRKRLKKFSQRSKK